MTFPSEFLFLIVPFVCYLLKKLNVFSLGKNLKAIAFFHPYANAGGGGERVLWQAVRCLQEKYPEYDYYVYTGDQLKEEELIRNVERSFNIKLLRPIKCLQIKSRFLVEAKYYKAFTLLGQSLASIILAIECLYRLSPLIVIDTMGYAFTYWVFRLFDCKMISYTHYPTISTDMLGKVTNSEDSFNNRQIIARSRFLTKLKLVYYHMFAYLYGLMGRFANLVMVNSSWTLNHINKIWKISDKTFLVYPPCNTDSFRELVLESEMRDKFRLLSIAQFRPEKNQKLQIEIADQLVNSLGMSSFKLVLIGSVRDDGDQERVNELKRLVKNFNLENNVEFKLNIPFKEMIEEMQRSNIGLHSMKNEHFGISVVEMMAAGLVVVANDSAGPQMDIVDHESNGYLASTLEEYVNIIKEVLNKDDKMLKQIRESARAKSAKFSDSNFEETFINHIKDLL